MRKDTFGINMKEWCKAHDSMVYSALKTGNISPDLVSEHEKKLSWLQHERLVHLIVTVMTTIIELFLLDLTLLHPELGIYPALFLLGFAILLSFYFYHYFFLENTVQRWYQLYEELRKINNKTIMNDTKGEKFFDDIRKEVSEFSANKEVQNMLLEEKMAIFDKK